MKYISLFSGIEAASVAWEPLGWEPMAFSEIEPFPCAVLAQRFPDVPNLGDVTKIDWGGFIERNGVPDIVVGGSPCQSFSIAGGRESLQGQSALCFEYWRAVRDLRPRWFLWENVPGVFSTRDNAFGQFLGKMEELGYGMAWRTLDAQFFGVAQRRRRVFLVGHIGGMVGWASAVLFERESVRGNTVTSKQKRQELARAAEKRAGVRGECLAFDDTQITSRQNGNNPKFGDACHTLSTDSRSPVIAVQGSMIGRSDENGPKGCGFNEDVSFTLNTTDKHAVICMQDGQTDSKCGLLGNEIVGPLCAADAKMIGTQYVKSGKVMYQAIPQGRAE